MDLQDIYRSKPKLLIATVALFVAVIVVVIILTIGSGGSSPKGQSGQSPTERPTSRTPAVTVPNPNYHPSYARHLPASPFDQQYASQVDASGQAIAAVEAVNPAKPEWTTAFPRVPAAATTSDQTYLVAFLRELLDRDYRTQPRTDLQRWVSAETGAELLPGEPHAAAVRVLYAELFTPRAVGKKADPVPSASAWSADAHRGVTQHASGITVMTNPKWSQFISEGLTSVDPLLRVDDVSGTLATTAHGRTVRHRFSGQILVASALHHRGYGVASFDVWRVM